MLELDNEKIWSVAIGDTPISKIYKGNELVYQKGNILRVVSNDNTIFICHNGKYRNYSEGQIEYVLTHYPNQNIGGTQEIVLDNEITSLANILGGNYWNGNNYNANLIKIDLSGCTIYHTSLINMSNAFAYCFKLQYLDVSSIPTNIGTVTDMLSGTLELTHIKCKQSFKDKCIASAGTQSIKGQIGKTLEDLNAINWEIVD